MKKFIFLALPLIALFAGCSNPYGKFYNDYTGGINVADSPYVIMPIGKPKLIQGSNIKADYLKMLENGYFLIGESNFWRHGRRLQAPGWLHACLIH